MLDKFAVGDNVDVSINLRGREWINPQGEAKYFNSLQGWRIIKSGDAGTTNATPPVEEKKEEDVPF